VAFGLAMPQVPALQQQPSVGSPLEYQVKAAYILNLVNLTEWPAAALGPSSNPFRVCVLGADSFRSVMENTVRGESVHGHPVVVERSTGDPDQNCQVLFVSTRNADAAAELLRTLGPAPVLTIGEADGFLRAGGVVRFVVDQGHVRFDVNRVTAEHHGLTLSSRLLRVARSVQ
jgi:hypothetical protein